MRILNAIVFGALASCLMWSMAATECSVNFYQCSTASERVGPSGALASSSEAWDVGWHDGFIWGVASMTIKKLWCPQHTFSENQLSAVVSKYVKEHPERWGEQPATLVVSALSEVFPCARKIQP